MRCLTSNCTQYEGMNSNQRPKPRKSWAICGPRHDEAKKRKESLVSSLRTIPKRGPRPPTYAKLGQTSKGTIACPTLELAVLSSKRPGRKSLSAQQIAAPTSDKMVYDAAAYASMTAPNDCIVASAEDLESDWAKLSAIVNSDQ